MSAIPYRTKALAKPPTSRYFAPASCDRLSRPHEAAHDVERDREQLQAEEDRDKRRGRGQDHHADHRGHDQDVELAFEKPALLQVRVRQGDRQDAEGGEQDLEEEREIVAGSELVKRGATLPVQPAIHGGGE